MVLSLGEILHQLAEHNELQLTEAGNLKRLLRPLFADLVTYSDALVWTKRFVKIKCNFYTKNINYVNFWLVMVGEAFTRASVKYQYPILVNI